MQAQVRLLGIVMFGMLMAALAIPASAQTYYSNGAINGTGNGWTICSDNATFCGSGYSVADSFHLTAGSSNLTGVQFGAWTFLGDNLTSVDWAITTSPFGGTTEASGTAGVSSTFLFTHDDNLYNIDLDSFSLGGVTLGPGTYYLQLSNAVSTTNNADSPAGYWDNNNGPSAAYQYGDFIDPSCPTGCDINLSNQFFTGSNSESFQIYGPGGPTQSILPVSSPEPGTLALLGLGLFSLALVRRKANHAVSID